MTSTVSKRSIVIGGHKTSVSLEEPFWTGLKEIASRRAVVGVGNGHQCRPTEQQSVFGH
jgi:predicted DNA-binding ribbon-helix-helix protein